MGKSFLCFAKNIGEKGGFFCLKSDKSRRQGEFYTLLTLQLTIKMVEFEWVKLRRSLCANTI